MREVIDTHVHSLVSPRAVMDFNKGMKKNGHMMTKMNYLKKHCPLLPRHSTESKCWRNDKFDLWVVMYDDWREG